MKMKKFDKPSCEIVKFDSTFITTSSCGCYDEDFGVLPKDCLGDIAYCGCSSNSDPNGENCSCTKDNV